VEELKDAAWKLQRIMHDEAIFVPAYSVDFMRIGSWRWVKWPNCETTRFCPPVVYDPHEVFVFWIDDAIKSETQAARRTGRAFPESTKTVDVYRLTPDAPAAAAPPAPPPSIDLKKP
jgi:microcin C transport system substrate-binding protein